MSDEQISSGADFETPARQLARRFDADPARATGEFRDLLARKGLAGKILQFLNRIDRHDVVAVLGGTVAVDAKTQELVVTEIARGLAQSGRQKEAEDLLARAAASRRGDYNFHFAAGRVMAEARQWRPALTYFEAAWTAKPTQQAAERVLLAHLALEQYREAASAMGRILRAGTYREAMAKDFAYLLRQIQPGTLDPDLAFALSALPNSDDEVGSALMPHLVAGDMMDGVQAVIDRDVAAFGQWPEASLMGLIAYLSRHRKIEQLLRVHDHYDGGSAAVASALGWVMGDLPVEQRTQFLTPSLADFAAGADAKSYVQAAARFAKTADAEDGLAMLRLIPAAVAKTDAPRFFAREKSRIARLALHVAATYRDAAIEMLVAVALHVVDPEVAEFFSGSDLRGLADTIAVAKRQAEAPDGSRLARLRDAYFPFHLERRTGVDPDGLVNDIRFCEAVFDYFHAVTQMRPALSAPAGRTLAARLDRPALMLDGGRYLDVLGNWGLMQARPMFSLAPPGHYEQFYAWYLNAFFAGRRMSPDCLNSSLAAYFNEPVARDALSGLHSTRYLKIAARTADLRKAFDLGNVIDRHLMVLGLIAASLSQNTQFLPFFQPFLRDGARDTALGRMIEALGGAALLDALAGKAPALASAAVAGGAQDVLLIGHASKQTGLGRNFGMLAKGLTADGIALTGLDFDAGADAFNDALARWREGLRSKPIVVLAVNAHDVPDVFVKDRLGLLADCYTAGFYLWEVSRIPRLQQLGVDLVDEVWAPTRYVADIYAPHAPTHVVGKGLFAGDEPFLTRPKPLRVHPRFTFVTVFDFDSSIERKNPLAVALAFQKAFPGSEKVELVVKTSNVNPRHWSNAWGQWERLAAAAAQDKRVRIVAQRYTDDEMTALVRDADCVVSLHRSEGFGYLMADAMAFGTPVIATDYSGNADFCTAETSFPVSHSLIAVPPGAARWRCDDAQWADPGIEDAARQMRAVFADYDTAIAKAARARAAIKTGYGIATFRAALAARVRAIATQLA